MMALLAATIPRRVPSSTLPLRHALSLGPLTHSPFAGASSRVLFVSAHSTHHMLALLLTHASSSGARLQPSVHRVLQFHTDIQLLLAGDSNIWFPDIQLGRSRQADVPLLPIVQEILQSHSLVFRTCLLVQYIHPVCTTGPLWSPVSPLGTSPSWPTSLAHSLTFLSVLPFWTLSRVLLRITLVVALGPAHAQGNLSGGMMCATTLWLLATVHGPFPTTSSTHSLRFASLTSCTNLADLMLPSLTSNSLVHSPSATSLHRASLLQPGLALRGSIHLEVQPRPGHQARW